MWPGNWSKGESMPAKDFYHDTVKHALIKDGWTITHDPYVVEVQKKDVYVDLGAEGPLGAEKAGELIAVEIKSFRGVSDLRDFEFAVGQFVFYRSLIARYDPMRKMCLAVPAIAFANTFQEPIVRPALDELHVPLTVFRPQDERIIRWIT